MRLTNHSNGFKRLVSPVCDGITGLALALVLCLYYPQPSAYPPSYQGCAMGVGG